MKRKITAALLVAATLAGCGGATASTQASGPRHSSAAAPASSSAAATIAADAASATSAGVRSASSTASSTASAVHKPVSRNPSDHYPSTLGPRWQAISTIGARPALWIERRAGVTLVRIDQSLVHLALHAGSVDPGGAGWRYGDQVSGRELGHLILGFNGGFKFSTGAGGFFSFGRTALPLIPGRGSIVTYRDGLTEIGAWQRGLPARGRPLASVRQNLELLVAGGRPAASVGSCGSTCWGATIGGGSVVARSGLGIQRNGRLIWAAGANLTVEQLAAAMVGVGVVGGVQLDINPDWVAGYLYVHRRHAGPRPVPVVPGQYGISGALLSPYGRDFFTVLSN